MTKVDRMVLAINLAPLCFKNDLTRSVNIKTDQNHSIAIELPIALPIAPKCCFLLLPIALPYCIFQIFLFEEKPLEGAPPTSTRVWYHPP